jgi:PhnB protein
MGWDNALWQTWVVNFGGAAATDTRQGKMHSGMEAFVMMTHTSADSGLQIPISANERRSVLSVPTAISWVALILFILAALQISVAILFAVHRTEIWDAIETFNPSAAKETLAIIALGTSIGSVIVHVLFAVLYFSLAVFIRRAERWARIVASMLVIVATFGGWLFLRMSYQLIPDETPYVMLEQSISTLLRLTGLWLLWVPKSSRSYFATRRTKTTEAKQPVAREGAPNSLGVMKNIAKPVPDGYHTATPYLIVKDAASAIEFYERAFGATERVAPDGKVKRAEIKIGDSVIMLADGSPAMGSPRSLEGSAVRILLYVEDVDARFQQAVDAGAKVTRPVQDEFYGDRSGTLEDPAGHVWTIATHQEDVLPEEISRRAEAF